MKKNILGVFMALVICFLVQQPKDVYAANTQYELENNNSFENANFVNPGCSVIGSVSERGDVDFYKFVPDKNGKLELFFGHTYEESYDDWDVYTYVYENGQYVELSCTNIDLNSNERISLPFIGVTKNRTYFVKVQQCCSGVIGRNYCLYTTFQSSNYIERECNDIYATATEIELNKTYSGIINNKNDKDCYKISVPKDGKISISFMHSYEDSYDDWNVYTYLYKDGQYIQLSSTNIDLNGSEKIELPFIGTRKNDVCYVRVEKCCSGVIGKEYDLKISFKASEYFEKETNNTYATATDLLIEHAYRGTINNTDDKDCFNVIMPKGGVVDLYFEHPVKDSYDDWNVRIYKYHDGEYEEVVYKNIDLNSNKKIYLGTFWANNNLSLYIKVEKCCSGVIGEEYSLKSEYQLDGPFFIDILKDKNKVKLSWDKVESGVDGYEIYYRVGTTGKFKKLKSVKKTSYTYSNLVKGKTYYFKVRGYKKMNGKTYRSRFSYTKCISI